MNIHWLTDTRLSMVYLCYSRWALKVARNHPIAGYPMAVFSVLVWILPIFPVAVIGLFAASAIDGLMIEVWTGMAVVIVLIVPFLLVTIVAFAAMTHAMEVLAALTFAIFNGGKSAARRLSIVETQLSDMVRRRALK